EAHGLLDRAGHDEHRGRPAALLEHRDGVVEEVAVAVVEGEGERVLAGLERERGDVLEADHALAAAGDQVELPREALGRERELVVARRDAVPAQHAQPAARELAATAPGEHLGARERVLDEAAPAAAGAQAGAHAGTPGTRAATPNISVAVKHTVPEA